MPSTDGVGKASPHSSHASSRAEPRSTHSTRESDVTLTSGVEGISDYQAYLEKTSNPKGSSLVANPSPTANIPFRNKEHTILASRPPTPISEIQYVADQTTSKSRRAKRATRSKPHRVERVEDPHEYPGPLALTLLTIGICLSVFLVSLDRTIVATAIPRITDDFHSYNDVGWYGSAYLVAAGALQPLYGRIFIMFNIKWSFLLALAMFELGSLICGVAPNSTALIIGRAIAGWGSAGILTGSFVVVSHAVPLVRRPVFTASVGVMFGLGAIVGPLLGGVFTELVTWRWCFYFNLPVGGATVLAMIFFFTPHKDAQTKEQAFVMKALGLDLIGNFMLIVAAVLLFLALQFQEEATPWRSARIIGLLIGCGLMAIMFCAWQWYKGDDALLPGKIVCQRSVAASCTSAFLIYGAILIHAYYLPIWFQAIKGANAIQSGVDLIPYMIANAIFSVFAGILVSKLGYYTPPAIVGAAIGTVGCGLLTTLEVHSHAGKWIGYQILISAGLGMAVQQGVIAVQTVLPLDRIPIGIAAIVSMQSLGGAVFVSVGNNILQNQLSAAAAAKQLPGVDIKAVLAAGATQFRSRVPADVLPALLVAYNSALSRVFLAAIPLSGLACLAALGLEWRSVKTKKTALEAAITQATTELTYSMATCVEETRTRRRSEDSERTTDSEDEKHSFETARTSLQIHTVDRDEPVIPMTHDQASRLSVPGSWNEHQS